MFVWRNVRQDSLISLSFIEVNSQNFLYFEKINVDTWFWSSFMVAHQATVTGSFPAIFSENCTVDNK